MTIRAALLKGSGLLGKTGPDTPFLDAALLLAHVLEFSRTRLLASMPEELPIEKFEKFMALVKRRASGEAVAYIIREKEFFGHSFYVDYRVLVPRPETELLVEHAIEVLENAGKSGTKAAICHDAFCGSGCVGLSIARKCPGIKMGLSDKSLDALEVCKINAKKLFGQDHNIDISFGNILAAAPSGLALVTANPPYVEASFVDKMEKAGSLEPRLALDGGAAGLDLYPSIAKEAFGKLNHNGSLLLEIGDKQSSFVKAILEEAGFIKLQLVKDMAGLDRLVMGTKP
ncbi:peptide chain release factor N(5)-glutamine methyltransferase [Spirochaetota bacterium]